MKNEGFEIGNIDATVIAERPKLMPHIKKIRETIAVDLGLSLDQISVKATTSEKMGFVGREEGISATATALLKPM